MTAPEDLLPALFTRDEALTLTDHIRAVAGDISDRFDDLAAMVLEAHRRRADLALGYSGWAAYIADVVGTIHADAEQRKAIVGYLSAAGLSTRAIAPALGVDQKTVVRDLAAGEANASPARLVDPPPPRRIIDPMPNVVGLDGKAYRRPDPKPVAPEPDPVRDEARRRDAELDRSNERAARALSGFVTGWAVFRHLRDDPNRDAILAKLPAYDRVVLTTIERDHLR